MWSRFSCRVYMDTCTALPIGFELWAITQTTLTSTGQKLLDLEPDLLGYYVDGLSINTLLLRSNSQLTQTHFNKV